LCRAPSDRPNSKRIAVRRGAEQRRLAAAWLAWLFIHLMYLAPKMSGQG